MAVVLAFMGRELEEARAEASREREEKDAVGLGFPATQSLWLILPFQDGRPFGTSEERPPAKKGDVQEKLYPSECPSLVSFRLRGIES